MQEVTYVDTSALSKQLNLAAASNSRTRLQAAHILRRLNEASGPNSPVFIDTASAPPSMKQMDTTSAALRQSLVFDAVRDVAAIIGRQDGSGKVMHAKE